MNTNARNLIVLMATIIAAVLIAAFFAQPPKALPASADPALFSAGRAFDDVRAIARAPHVTGSEQSAQVRAYLVARMQALGMQVRTQTAPLSPDSIKRLARWSGAPADGVAAVNLIGVLPGRDPRLPAVALMAHYDTVWGSPGAADDSTGVAAALEIARALRVQGGAQRDVMVILTDAEELGLDGAKAFFAQDPAARRIGAVMNFETRGAGGRTAMFETGPQNGAMMDLFKRSVRRPFANSLSVLLYGMMPNSSDYTVAKQAGAPGFNFAFIGRSGLYHSPLATPESLDQAALQDMGGQGLDLARALAMSPHLPSKAPDVVFGDLMGLSLVSYSTLAGWGVWAGAVVLTIVAALASRRGRAGGVRRIGWGMIVAAGVTTIAALLLAAGGWLSGGGAGANYYDRLAALPRLEVQAGLIALSVVAGAGAVLNRSAASREGRAWGLWLGSVVLALLGAGVLQAVAPTAAPLLAWPALWAATGSAVVAVIDPSLQMRRSIAVVAVLGVAGLAFLMLQAHWMNLAIGDAMPYALAVYVLLGQMFWWPLAATAPRRALALAAAIAMVGAVGVGLWVRWDAPAASIAVYSRR